MKVLVLGDSHSRVFNYCNSKQSSIFFDVIIVSGATAQGSVNPNSKTNALMVFKEKLTTIKKKEYSYIIINLGEVDCGYLIWYRMKKYNISIEEQLTNSTDNLFSFIKEVVNYFDHSFIIINGSILPTIQDNTDKNFLAGARSEINNSQLERTKLTLRYNDILKRHCLTNQYKYMDITSYILNKKTNIVHPKYLNKCKHDHHLDDETTYMFWLKELYSILYG
jgi:hypothetical protein